ncbi:hypothetical protein ElyMa_003983000 [Elysia marginata]|uniref:Uncharacterized protein n=1 Tax=Elysia marginata TaxID=1093978 RepID=A0AAV4FZ72_9GAST|nr:hypothetical protein ElyMa_003983000 [Elysia marginata]
MGKLNLFCSPRGRCIEGKTEWFRERQASYLAALDGGRPVSNTVSSPRRRLGTASPLALPAVRLQIKSSSVKSMLQSRVDAAPRQGFYMYLKVTHA